MDDRVNGDCGDRLVDGGREQALPGLGDSGG